MRSCPSGDGPSSRALKLGRSGVRAGLDPSGLALSALASGEFPQEACAVQEARQRPSASMHARRVRSGALLDAIHHLRVKELIPM